VYIQLSWEKQVVLTEFFSKTTLKDHRETDEEKNIGIYPKKVEFTNSDWI
jgi:hypothetical protein